MPLRTTGNHDNFPSRSALALLTAALVVVGCADPAAAPKAAREITRAQPQLSTSYIGGSFTYNPWDDQTVQLGRNHYLVIPAGGICDIGNSSYGPKYWDSWCRAEDRRTSVTFKVYSDITGHPFVEFNPPLRFVPSKTVLLYLADASASMDDYSQIWYCPDNRALPCVDESVTDRSLKAVRDRRGNIYRRIKHFSGYNVAAGAEEAEEARWSMSSSSPSALASEGKKSGYMVVSGAENRPAQDDSSQGPGRPEGDRN